MIIIINVNNKRRGGVVAMSEPKRFTILILVHPNLNRKHDVCLIVLNKKRMIVVTT